MVHGGEHEVVSRLTRILRRGRRDSERHELRGVSSEYIDGELDEAAAARAKSHLDWCGPCNAFINTLRATVALLGNMPKRETPSEFRERVRENLRKKSRSSE